MSFAHVNINGEWRIATIDDDGVIRGWEIDDLDTIYETDDIINYDTRDEYIFVQRMRDMDSKKRDIDFSKHVEMIEYEITIKKQLEIMKNSITTELEVGNTLHTHGVQKIENFINKEMAEELRKYIVHAFDTCVPERDIDPLPYGKKRHDLVLDREGIVDEVINYIQPKVEALVGKKIVEIVEIRCLINDPGSTQQWVHVDRPVSNTFACFVGIHDVTPDMGPTKFIPGTNNSETTERFHKENNIGFPLDQPNVIVPIKQGDAYIYNQCTLHCGTPNVSNTRRYVFYITCEFPED